MARVIVFARAPQLGRVKRRLARGVGAGTALQFHGATLRTVTRRLSADRRWQVALAVTPDRFVRGGRWWPRGIARIPQGGGDLGVRMMNALRRYRGTPTVLIGSDIPDVSRAHIADALRAVRSGALVFGPATDGGYWLIGARNIERYYGLFRGVRWSTKHALADTLANVAGAKPVKYAATLSDVDEAAVLRRS
jgi:rSAM/selenodomain-associated transferase 1